MPRIASALVVVGALLVGACGPGQQLRPATPAASEALGPVVAVPVSEATFAARTLELLREGAPSTERRNRLAGVVAAQLGHASQRFEKGDTAAGLAALRGAFLLVRAPEDDPALYATHAAAIAAAAAGCSRAGREGCATALYQRLVPLLPAGPTRADAQGHLAALAEWREAALKADPIVAAGFDQRLWSGRMVVDPGSQPLREAHRASVAWVELALDVDPSTLDLEDPRQRASAREAYTALQGGSAAVVALYLRHGDASGALAALDEGALAEITPPGLVARVQAASAGDPSAWADLCTFFAAAADAGTAELALDEDLARAASFGAAVELFRAAPSTAGATAPLAMLLPKYGMTEVAPLVLALGLGPGASPSELGGALAITLAGILAEHESGRTAIARRTFRAAAPILALAEGAKRPSEIRPSPARVHFAMAALEVEVGDPAAARPHLLDALRVDPRHLDALTLLAMVERQRRDDRAALDAVERAASVATRGGDDAAVASTHLLHFEIARDAGQAAEATLRAALVASLRARDLAHDAAALARAERLLARSLEHYAAADAARRATLRAVEAARTDHRELSASLIDGMRRALVLGELALGRSLAREAIAAELGDEDLVYVALWLRALEHRLSATPDGTVTEALAGIEKPGGWIAHLRDWGEGHLDDAGLIGRARTVAERTEATFYTTFGAGPGATPGPGFAAVANSPAIGLVEVAIARDLRAVTGGAPRVLPPADIALP